MCVLLVFWSLCPLLKNVFVFIIFARAAPHSLTNYCFIKWLWRCTNICIMWSTILFHAKYYHVLANELRNKVFRTILPRKNFNRPRLLNTQFNHVFCNKCVLFFSQWRSHLTVYIINSHSKHTFTYNHNYRTLYNWHVHYVKKTLYVDPYRRTMNIKTNNMYIPFVLKQQLWNLYISAVYAII